MSDLVDFGGSPPLDLAALPDLLPNRDAPPTELGGTADLPTPQDLGVLLDSAMGLDSGMPSDSGRADLALSLDSGSPPDLAPGVKLPSFLAAPRFGVGGSPHAIATADVNGDGKADLAVGLDVVVSVFLGDGRGGFGPPTNYPVKCPVALAFADVNSDGRPDLVAATSYCGDGVSVLLNIGNGAFGPAVGYPVGAESDRFAIGDLDGDGSPDLAVASGAGMGGLVIVLMNRGNGTFAGPVNYAAGQSADDVVVGDFNGDGWADLAAADGLGSNVNVFLNLGKGAFAQPASYATGFSPRYLATGDLDGDGSLDLAVQEGDLQHPFALLFNRGNGTFGAPIHAAAVPDNSEFGPLVTGDFNGDGKPDLAIVGQSVSVFLNQGKGAFIPSPLGYIAGSSPIGAAAADLDGDGRIDLAVANNVSNDVSALLNVGGGTFAGALEHEEAFAGSVALGDLDGDGWPDVAVAGVTAGVGVFLNQGKGVFGSPTDYPVGARAQSTSAVVIADLDGDGKPDLAAADKNGGAVATLRNAGKGAFLAAVNYPAGAAPTAIVASDFDGDGKVDLAVTNDFGNGQDGSVSLLLNKGMAVFGAPAAYPIRSQPTSLAVGDIDGDGRPDLLVTDEGSDTMSVLINSGKGTFAPTVDYPTGVAPRGVAIGDVNGDGRPDAVIAAWGSEVDLFLNQGKGVFAPRIPYVVKGIVGKGSTPWSVVVGDLNGDNKPDLATVTADHQEMVALVNNGDGTFTEQVAISVGGGGGLDAPQAVALADLNGDGLNDLAIANRDGCAVLINTTH